ncbi:MAG: YkoF family thiamine/hydroxymethylpyrimidine-binding protein [Gammaproteobacteria bacterium]|nr:YkoF family thiamine/hydroxymethylpyrimidine-binding protein [Gammaproteobacteria bacterium]MCY4341058.1 YkoF family thiamine/hydroxymethylpyrimidine-binding protein [Gammaproteobacteria bacterium]
MRITAELSLYPLASAEPIGRITGFIRELREQSGIEVLTNQMSTQLRGELEDVQRAVDACMKAVMESGDRVVLAAKYINADLPIASPPQL